MTHVIVSQGSFDSDHAYDLITSNLTVVNLLRGQDYADALLTPASRASYWVDFYRAQMAHGGFAQLVYNSKWTAAVVDDIRAGLVAISLSPPCIKRVDHRHSRPRDVDSVARDDRQIVYVRGRGEQRVNDRQWIGNIEPSPDRRDFGGDLEDAIDVVGHEGREPALERSGGDRIAPPNALDPALDLPRRGR